MSIATAPIGGGLVGRTTKTAVSAGLTSLGVTGRIVDPVARIFGASAAGATASEIGLFAQKGIVEGTLPTSEEVAWTAGVGGGIGGLGQAGGEAWQAWRATRKAPQLKVSPSAIPANRATPNSGRKYLANEPMEATIIHGEPNAAGETMYAGGYDPELDHLYLKEGYGHADGMGDAGGDPRIGITPGITLFSKGDKVAWANESGSLTDPKLTQQQIQRMQAAIEKKFPNKAVTFTKSLNEAIDNIRETKK